MPWNGSGTFNRIYSWVADKAAGLDISSTRMDSDTNDIASQGFGNCLTRDGQGGPTTNLPMNNFKHTGVANGSLRTDYTAVGQTQDGLLYWTIDSGSATAYACTYTPALVALNDGQLCTFRATNANTGTAPTFAPNGLTAHTITRLGGSALAVGDIQANQEVQLRYNFANTRWELLNPSLNTVIQTAATTGDVKLTVKTVADPGWLLFDDTDFGSSASGANNASNSNQALFTLFFNNISDSSCPIFTSTGAGTTRAAQGTAAAAWAANCRMRLPRAVGRALAVAGTGAGLSARPLGSNTGVESEATTLAQLPTGITSTAANTITVYANGNSANYVPYTINNITGTSAGSGANTALPTNQNGSAWAGINAFSASNTINVTSNNTSGATHSLMQPSTFLNAMIKQ